MVRNPFRDPGMRTHYEGAIRAFEAGSLGAAGGVRQRGNGGASAFWQGYDGIGADQWDAASKKMIVYAYWRAGRDIRAREKKD